MNWTEKTRIVLTCGRGSVNALSGELQALGYSPEPVSGSSVGVWGNLEDAMRLNLWLRTASRVLFEVGGYQVDSPDELYDAVRDLPWEQWLRPDRPFHVQGVARHPSIRDGRFAVLRCKDAIADRFVDKTGVRPDSSADPEGASGVTFYWLDREVQVFIDTTGVPLSHRGYRSRSWTAPLREPLAAALLLEAGWGTNPAEAFLDPMCGSGTLAIEAAWIAQNRAPALFREDFAFLHLNEVDTGSWSGLQEEARTRLQAAPGTWIAASDIDPQAVDAARENARQAGVDRLIRFAACDFREAPLPRPPALVLMNPEYGERMGEPEGLRELYEGIGTWFKTSCRGMRCGVFTGNPALGRSIGLHPDRRSTLWNGGIECRLLQFEIYEGTRDPRLIRKHEGSSQ